MKKPLLLVLLIALASACFAKTEKIDSNSELYESISSEYEALGFEVLSVYTCESLEEIEELAGSSDDWVLIADEEIDYSLSMAVVSICKVEGQKVAVIMIYEDNEMLILMSDLN